MGTDKNNDNRREKAEVTNCGWTRRDLLVRGGQAVAAAGLAAGGAWVLYDPKGDAGLELPEPISLPDYFAEVRYDVSAPRLSVAFGESTLVDDVEHATAMVKAALGGLDGAGIKRFVGRGDVVLIKPNVGFDRSAKLAATTNPSVVHAVARLCLKEAKARKVVVADNPIENPAACFVKSGIKAAAEAGGASVLIHSSGHDAMVQIRRTAPDPARGEALGTWPIFWKPLAEATKVIGIAPIKDHNLCSASMTMKNWYGLLAGRRNQFHQAIHNIISDLGYMMSPTLVIGDGTRVMMDNGPTGGRLDDVKIGGIVGRPVVVASVDQVACDAWCYENLLGRDPQDARAPLAYIDQAYEKISRNPDRPVARTWKEYQLQGKIVETKL